MPPHLCSPSFWRSSRSELRRFCAVTVACWAILSTEAAQAGFSDVTRAAGITHRQHQAVPEVTFQSYMSGGAAAGDYDNDGWVDLYFTRLDGRDLLYRNQGDGTFQDVTATALGADQLASFATNGAAWGDIDNDGDLDLFVTSLFSHRYHLFINDGNGAFGEQAVSRGVAHESADSHFGFSATFGDYDRDGFLDLHTTEWRRGDQNPDGAPHNTRLFRNLGIQQPGFFEDVTEAAGVAMDNIESTAPNADSQSFTSRFSDFDGDGWPDLAIASDHRTSRLYWNDGDGTFSDGTLTSGVGSDEFGMGSAIGDVDGDGDFDWFVTSIYGDTLAQRDGNRLYRNDGDRQFTDITDDAGVRDGGWGWGTAMLDHDNDGDLDIAAANGQYFPFRPAISEGFEADALRLWENDGRGVFQENAAAQGLTDTGSGKALLTLDYDRDGDLDLLVVNNGGTPVLYRNDDGQNRNHLIVRPLGRISTRQSVGAVITVDPDITVAGDELIREIAAGNHFLGQSETMAHFGLGSRQSTVDRVTIRWLSGLRQTLHDVPVNQVLQPMEPIPEPATGTLAPLGAGCWLIRRQRRNVVPGTAPRRS